MIIIQCTIIKYLEMFFILKKGFPIHYIYIYVYIFVFSICTKYNTDLRYSIELYYLIRIKKFMEL